MAQIQLKSKYVLLALFGLILATFIAGVALGTINKRKALRNAQNALNDTCLFYQIEIDKKNVYIAQKNQEILTQREAIKQGEITREELKKLNLKQANEITRLKLRVDTLLENITHGGTIITIHDTITQTPINAILLPFDFNKQDEWLILKGKFDSNGKLDVNLSLDFNADLWAGVEKKTKINKALLTTDCPYIQTISFNSIKLDVPRKTRYGIGVQVGYGINLIGDKVVPTPYIGMGISYNIIRF